MLINPTPKIIKVGDYNKTLNLKRKNKDETTQSGGVSATCAVSKYPVDYM